MLRSIEEPSTRVIGETGEGIRAEVVEHRGLFLLVPMPLRMLRGMMGARIVGARRAVVARARRVVMIAAVARMAPAETYAVRNRAIV